MFVTVKDVLKLPVLSNTRLIAGEGGLDRKILRVSVTEFPEFPIDIEITGKHNLLFNEGDFFITGFYAIKDTPEKILDTIKLYNQYNCSGILISDRHFKDLPDEVIDFANNYSFPIIMFEHSTPYSTIIHDIMQMIILQKKDMVNEVIIDQLLNSNYNNDEIRNAAYNLNMNFHNNLQCICCKLDKLNQREIENVISDLNKKDKYFAIKYKKEILVFLNDKKNIENDQTSIAIDDFCRLIDFYTNNYQIGVSKAYEGLHNIKFCIKEAQIADKVAQIQNERISFYDNIGTYKLLLELVEDRVLEDYCNQFFMPIEQYDSEHRTDLLQTIFKYVESDGDVKKTAQLLFQHENTIRYRLVKIRQLLKIEEENIKFFENLAISSKIHNILNKIKNDKEN